MGGLRTAFQLLGIGWFIALSIVGGFLIGIWLDGLAGTRPFLALLGGSLGLTVAIVGIYKILLPLLKSREQNDT